MQTEGSGPDVVLIPGLNSSPRAWASTVAAMPGYRYHLVQVAGFGGAPAGGNKAGDVAAPVAEEIARYLREAGLERPAVIGHSMGDTRAFHELLVTNLGPELGKITVPVTVLYIQTRGVPMTAEQVDAVYQSVYAPIAGVTLKRIADSAHFIMWDQPQRFQAEFKAFVGAR